MKACSQFVDPEPRPRCHNITDDGQFLTGCRTRWITPETDNQGFAKWAHERERFTPDDMLAVAFHGLARRRMRGSPKPGQDVSSLADNLRGLADALDAFNNYRPGTFLNTNQIQEISADPTPPTDDKPESKTRRR